MATGFDTAQADIEQQRRDANAAIAAAGSAGAAAFAQGQQQIEAARAASVQQALSEAGQRGQGNIAGLLGHTINTPYAQLGAGLSSSAASHAADSAMMGGASDRYFRELGAAVPMSAAALEAAIARQKAKTKDLSDSELRTRLMGAGEMARDSDLGDAAHTHHLYQQRVEKAKAGISEIDKQLRAWKNGKKIDAHPHDLIQMRDQLEAELTTARTARAPITETLKNAGQHPVEEYARQAGLDAGEDPSRVLGLIQSKPATARQVYGNQPSVHEAAIAAGIKGPVLNSILKPGSKDAPSHWEKSTANAERYLKQGIPWRTFVSDAQRGLRGQPRTLKLLLAMYGPLFQAAER